MEPAEAQKLTAVNPLAHEIVIYFRNVPASLKKGELSNFIRDHGVTYKEVRFGCITRNSINSYAEVSFDNVGDAWKCVRAVNGKQLLGKDVKAELSAMLVDQSEESPASTECTSSSSMIDVPQIDSKSVWLASNRTILIQGLTSIDSQSVYDHCHMALGVNALTNLNISRGATKNGEDFYFHIEYYV